MNPIESLLERTARTTGGLEVFQLRQQDRKLILGHRTRQPGRIPADVDFVQDRNGLTPVALPAEKPVAKLVFYGRFSQS